MPNCHSGMPRTRMTYPSIVATCDTTRNATVSIRERRARPRVYMRVSTARLADQPSGQSLRVEIRPGGKIANQGRSRARHGSVHAAVFDVLAALLIESVPSLDAFPHFLPVGLRLQAIDFALAALGTVVGIHAADLIDDGHMIFQISSQAMQEPPVGSIAHEFRIVDRHE